MNTTSLCRVSVHRYWALGALAVVMLVGLGLRTWRLADESPWWDETVALERLSASNLVEFIRLERAVDPPMTPVYFTVAYFWSRLTTTSTLAMRMLSVLLGVISIPVIFLIGKRLYGVGAGLISALALALALPHIYYSQEVRVYSLVVLLALLSMLTLLDALRGKSRLLWIVHTTCNFLLAFTHLFAVYVFAAQWCYLVIFRRSEKRIWTFAHVAIALLLFAWLKTVDMSHIDDAACWIVQPGLHELAMILLIFAGGRPSNENPVSHLPTGVSLDVVLAGAIGLIIAVFVVKTLLLRKTENSEPERWKGGEALVLLLLWFGIPFAALLTMSLVWRPCFVYRYILYGSLPLYLLLGGAFSAMRSRRMAAFTGCALLLISAHQLSAMATGPFRPDWRTVSRYLESRARSDDAVIAFQNINADALRFNSILPDEQIQCVEVWSAVCGAVMDAHAAGHDAWIVVWLWSDPSNIERCFPENNLSFSYLDFDGWPRLRVYHIPQGLAP